MPSTLEVALVGARLASLASLLLCETPTETLVKVCMWVCGHGKYRRAAKTKPKKEMIIYQKGNTFRGELRNYGEPCQAR